MTFSEVKLWNELKRAKMLGYDFDRQRPIGTCVVDFYCKDLGLAIEVDGLTHDSEEAMQRDKVRQEELEAYGVSFLHFYAMILINDVQAVLKEIATWITVYEKENGVP